MIVAIRFSPLFRSAVQPVLKGFFIYPYNSAYPFGNKEILLAQFISGFFTDSKNDGYITYRVSIRSTG